MDGFCEAAPVDVALDQERQHQNRYASSTGPITDDRRTIYNWAELSVPRVVCCCCCCMHEVGIGWWLIAGTVKGLGMMQTEIVKPNMPSPT